MLPMIEDSNQKLQRHLGLHGVFPLFEFIRIKGSLKKVIKFVEFKVHLISKQIQVFCTLTMKINLQKQKLTLETNVFRS